MKSTQPTESLRLTKKRKEALGETLYTHFVLINDPAPKLIVISLVAFLVLDDIVDVDEL